jgi:hypothetical protein
MCSFPREPHVSKIYITTEPHQLPIVYREEYNVHFGGIERLHPFDAAKWGHIFQVGNIFLFKCGKNPVVHTGIYMLLFLLVKTKQVAWGEQAISTESDTIPFL